MAMLNDNAVYDPDKKKTVWEIDWDKVKTLDDMKLLFSAINLEFYPDYEKLGEVFHMLREKEVK